MPDDLQGLVMENISPILEQAQGILQMQQQEQGGNNGFETAQSMDEGQQAQFA